MKNKSRNIFYILLLPIAFLLMSNLNEEELIELKLDYKIGEKFDYIIRKSSIDNRFHLHFGSKTLIETKIQFIPEAILNDTIFNFQFKHSYIKYSDSSYSKGLKTFDTRIAKPDELPYGKLRYEIDKIYKISLNKKGKVVKNWTYNNQYENSEVFYMHNFQIIFPKEKVKIGSKWEYDSKGPFTIYDDTKYILCVKDINDKKIRIEYKSFRVTNGVLDNPKAYGEFILNKSDCSLLYAKIQSEINGSPNILEIEKK